MHTINAVPWEIRGDIPLDLHRALYIGNAYDIEPAIEIGPLLKAVPLRHHSSDRDILSEQWTAWWDALLQTRTTLKADTAADRNALSATIREDGLPTPDSELAELAGQHETEFRHWWTWKQTGLKRIAVQDKKSCPTFGHDWHLLNELNQPVSIHVDILGVAGPYFRAPSNTYVVTTTRYQQKLEYREKFRALLV